MNKSKVIQVITRFVIQKSLISEGLSRDVICTGGKYGK